MYVNQKNGNEAEAALKPTEFSYSDNNKLNAIIINGQLWFFAKNVSSILGFKKTNDATRLLDDDEKGAYKVRTLGGKQSVSLINESGLYNLIFRSNKPEAKSFRKWVTSEVLPALRRTGRYGTTEHESLVLQMGKAVKGVYPMLSQGKLGYPRKELLIACGRSYRNGYRLAKRYAEDCFYIGRTACVSMRLAELISAQHDVRQLELNFGDMKSGGVQ